MGEVKKDWFQADKDILMGKVPDQFYDAKSFVERVIANNKSSFNSNLISQTGQSLGGALAELTGALLYGKEGNYHTIETNTFNSLGVYDVLDKLISNGENVSNDYSNINNFTYNNEVISKIKYHLGQIYNSDIDADSTYKDKNHSIERLNYLILKTRILVNISKT